MVPLIVALENQQGWPPLRMKHCVSVVNVVIPVDNPKWLEKNTSCMTPKFVRYMEYKVSDMESLASTADIF